MIRRRVDVALFLALVSASIPCRLTNAEDVPSLPEALLAEESVLYLRSDGLGSHRDAFNKTTTAKLLQNELQPLVDDLTQRILEALGPQLLSERLLEGISPDELLKVQSATKQIPHLLDFFLQQGVAIGVEVISPLKPQFQVTMVFAKGGQKENRAAIFGGFQLLGLVSQSEIKEVKIGDRTVLQLSTPEPVNVRCWQESEHTVLTIGTEDIDHTLELVQGKRRNLTTNAVYKQLAEFDSYETIQRGFFDLDRVTALVKNEFPPAMFILDTLGLTGLSNASFHIGYQDEYIRSTYLLEIPGERKGLLQLLTADGALDFENLPALPPDSAAIAAGRLDLGKTYDAAVDLIKLALSSAGPSAIEEFEKGLKSVEKDLGVDLRADIIAALGSTIVAYNSPSEGPLTFGMALGIEVKQEAGLAESLDTFIKSLGATTGADVAVNKRNYRGTDVYTVEVGEPGFPFVPSFAVHDGWLVAGFFPQPVQGFIYRSAENHRTWELPAIAQRAARETAAADSNGRITAISVSDPRPTLTEIAAIAPFLTKIVSSFSGQSGDFDVALIPNAQSLTEPLTPNVSVVLDNGRSIRIESYSSLPLPIQLTGMEFYFYAFAYSAFSFGAD